MRCLQFTLDRGNSSQRLLQLVQSAVELNLAVFSLSRQGGQLLFQLLTLFVGMGKS